MSQFTLTPDTGIKIFFLIDNIIVSSVTMSFDNQSLTNYETMIDLDLENGEQIHNLNLKLEKYCMIFPHH